MRPFDALPPSAEGERRKLKAITAWLAGTERQSHRLKRAEKPRVGSLPSQTRPGKLREAEESRQTAGKQRQVVHSRCRMRTNSRRDDSRLASDWFPSRRSVESQMGHFVVRLEGHCRFGRSICG